MNLVQLLKLIKQFCEMVPNDYDYELDETCIYSVMREELIKIIDKWTTRALNETESESSIYQKCQKITEDCKAMAEPCALLHGFIRLEHGEDYKSFLQHMTGDSTNSITFDEFRYKWLPNHCPYGDTLIKIYIKALKSGQISFISYTKTNSMGIQTSAVYYKDDDILPCVQGLKSGKFPYNKKAIVEVLITDSD